MSYTTSKVQKNLTAKEIVLTAMFTALISVCAWIRIPIGPVSFTLQILGIFLAVCILGGRNGLFAVLAYLMIGAVGLPVFDGFSGGISAFLSNSGGYLIGFIFIPLFYWCGEKFFGEHIIVQIISLVIGLAVCYAFGTVWFMHMYSLNTGAVTLGTAMKWCVIPFIPFDILKMIAAFIISDRIKKYAKI